MENYIFEDNEESRDYVLNLLKTSVIDLKFIKADGSERNMKCTLVSEKIPVDKAPKGNSNVSTECANVFDVEADGWRRFRWDSLLEVYA